MSSTADDEAWQFVQSELGYHRREPAHDWAPLLHPDAHGQAKPKRDDLPVLVLEWRGRHLLIDGINRVNRCVRERSPGPQDVIVIHGGES
jgi:hypothetical protein